VKNGKIENNSIIERLHSLTETECRGFVFSLEKEGWFSVRIEDLGSENTRVVISWKDWVNNHMDFTLGEAIWHDVALHLIYVIGRGSHGRKSIIRHLRDFS
jgi:hypothetical protein